MSKGGKYALGGSTQKLKRVEADHYGLERAQKGKEKKAAANKAVSDSTVSKSVGKDKK